MNFFTRIGCYLVGWNPAILKQCGEASHRTLRRYMSAIIILSIIWGAIGYCFAERYIGLESTFAKLLTSATFIIIIICIERFIILTVGKLGLTGVFRFFLAFLMAVLGSAVFDQIIFRQDVEVKMKEVRTEQINKEIPKRMSFLDADIRKLTHLIDSIGKENVKIYADLAKNPVIVATDVSTTTRQNGVDAAGKSIEEKTTNVTKRNVENPLNAQAKANETVLQLYQKQLDDMLKRKMSVADDVRTEYEQVKIGFLEELKALCSILVEDPIAMGFYIFLFLFLMFLEMLVVTSRSGDMKCDYDLMIEHQLNIKKETLQKTSHRLLDMKD